MPKEYYCTTVFADMKPKTKTLLEKVVPMPYECDPGKFDIRHIT